MSRLVACTLTAILASAPSLAIAQSPMGMQDRMGMRSEAQSEPKDLTDARIDVVKDALQLTSDQMKYWPPIEEAIRARAEERRDRFADFVARMHTPQPDRNFVKVLQNRAENLAERAAGLKRLADAWQPLYGTLTEAQKRRMRILAAVVVRDVRDGMEMRHFQMMEDDDAGGAITGAGSGEGGAGQE